MRSMLRFSVPMILGNCMGSGAVFSIRFGAQDQKGLKEGVVGIWWSVPIGWFLADTVGVIYYMIHRKRLLLWKNSRDEVMQ